MSNKKNKKRPQQPRKRNPVNREELEERFTKVLHTPYCWSDAAPYWKGAKAVRKRVDACYNVIGSIAEKYRDKYPEDAIVYQFEEANAIYSPDPVEMEGQYALSRAAALWMLDVFRVSGHMVDALDILNEIEFPKTTHSFDDEAAFFDSYYPTLTIQQMEAMIQDRINWNAMIEQPDASVRRGRTWDQYQRMLALIPDSYKEASISAFLEFFDKYVNVYLNCDTLHVQECIKLKRRESRLDAELKQALNRKKVNATPPIKAIASAPLVQGQPSYADRLITPSLLPQDEQMLSLTNSLSETITAIKTSACKRAWINENLVDLVLNNATTKSLNNAKMDGVIESCKPFTDAFRDALDQSFDPYIICMGYELLLDKNDDVIYMLHEMCAIMTITASYLPWGIFKIEKQKYVDTADKEPGPRIEADEERSADKGLEKKRPMPRIYNILPDACKDTRIRRMSIDQVMFGETRTLLPRSQEDLSEEAEALESLGVPKELIPTMLIGVQAQQARQYRDTWVYVPDPDEAPEKNRLQSQIVSSQQEMPK